MTVDQLKLNEGKTEIILIGTRQQLNKVNFGHLTIGNETVPKVRSPVRNPRSWFDSNLKWRLKLIKYVSRYFIICIILDK